MSPRKIGIVVAGLLIGCGPVRSADAPAPELPEPSEPASAVEPATLCETAPERVVPAGGPITVDGSVSAGEWDDAAPFAFRVRPDWTTTVRLKHDGEALSVLFTEFQPPSSPPHIVFPELALRVGDQPSQDWTLDDWWFHVSLTDCAAQGAHDDFAGCVPEATGWAANNFEHGVIDAVEIRIEFATLGIDATRPQNLGVLLRLSDTQGYARHWPKEADLEVPATWAEATLCP